MENRSEDRPIVDFDSWLGETPIELDATGPERWHDENEYDGAAAEPADFASFLAETRDVSTTEDERAWQELGNVSWAAEDAPDLHADGDDAQKSAEEQLREALDVINASIDAGTAGWDAADHDDVLPELPEESFPAVELLGVEPSSKSVSMMTMEQLPAPRVWFTTPAQIRVDDIDGEIEGAVLNLSRGGLALAVDCALSPGQRIWVRFRLGFVDEPNSYLCVIAWRRADEEGNTLYGCEFSGLSDDERMAIQAVVDTRSAGTVASWSLPALDEPPAQHVTVPTAEPPAGPSASRPRGRADRRRRGGRLAGVLGLAAGLLIAAWITRAFMGPETVIEGDDFGPKVQSAAKEAAPKIRVARADDPAESRIASPRDAGTEEAASSHAGTREAEESNHNEATSIDAVTGGVEPNAGTTSGREPVLRHNQGKVELALEVDGPANEHSTFWLDNPKRFVIDVHGRRSGFEQTRYELADDIVHRIRVGRHPDKVRFVLDVEGSARVSGEPRAEGHALVVTLEQDE